MALTTVNGSSILKPEQINDLIVTPLTQESVAFQVSTVARTDANQYRVPRVVGDPTTGWTPEGTEITPDDVDLDEILVTPRKVAGLTILSNELIADASEDAARLIGQRLVNSLRRKIDAAYFANATPNGPSGIRSVAGVTSVLSGVAGSVSNYDVFYEGAALVEAAGGQVTSWVASPAHAIALSRIKESTGSNKSLIQPDVTQPTRRQLAGAPLVLSPDLATPEVWGISKPYSIVVLRNDAKVEIDSSPFFTSDRTAVRVTLRVGFAFAHPAALAQVRLAAS